MLVGTSVVELLKSWIFSNWDAFLRDWKFSSHGRKIEKAISYRDDNGAKLKIISEEMLFDALPSSR